jgi:hypothetical protein
MQGAERHSGALGILASTGSTAAFTRIDSAWKMPGAMGDFGSPVHAGYVEVPQRRRLRRNPALPSERANASD